MGIAVRWTVVKGAGVMGAGVKGVGVKGRIMIDYPYCYLMKMMVIFTLKGYHEDATKFDF
jgi:hypothetical protein